MSIEWDGKGLPPVGCECELFDCEQWNPVRIKFVGEKYVVTHRIDWDYEVVYCVAERPEKFRRTEAERRREEAIRAIKDIIVDFDLTLTEQRGAEVNIALDIVAAIAAGKIPGVRLTDD